MYTHICIYLFFCSCCNNLVSGLTRPFFYAVLLPWESWIPRSQIHSLVKLNQSSYIAIDQKNFFLSRLFFMTTWNRCAQLQYLFSSFSFSKEKKNKFNKMLYQSRIEFTMFVLYLISVNAESCSSFPSSILTFK